MGSSSRFLLTVVPPTHLPHDPPHPRTNPQCSGYGPKEHFRRGILVPLYPTLSAQLAAISREYGLPSTGGLMLYLLSTVDPYTQAPLPGAAGFAGEGGPRISETAWNMLWSQLFAAEEEEQRMLDEEASDTDDEDYAPPPVPPLPLSHSTLPGSPRPYEGGAGVFSDDNERVSQSSDAGASGSSVYSNGETAKSRQNSSSAHRASSVARSGIGRGPPPAASLASPNSGKRFNSLPTASPHFRQSSRHSYRSTSHRPHTRSSYAHASPLSLGARSVSYGSYASSLAPPLPGYGASVVVGKVEFDIHENARGGQWYKTWKLGAIPSTSSASSSAVSSALQTPSTTVVSTEPWQELHLPSIVASKAPQPPQGSNVDEDFTPAAKPSPLPHVEHGESTPNARLRSSSRQSQGMETAGSNFSLAALAAHMPEETREEEQEREARGEHSATEETEADSSIVDKAAKALSRSSSSLPSRPASNASSPDLATSDKGTDDTLLMDEEERDASYQQLSESEDDVPAEKGEYRAMHDSDDGSQYGEEEPAAQQEAPPQQQDPLGDVFESDEATWRSFAADDTVPRLHERDAVETTGLGIFDARVADLESSAPEGVLERLPERETLDEQGLPPPQDDVADVAALLHSPQPSQPQQTNLASPIRLSSSSTAADETGVFPPSPARGSDGHDAASSSPFAKVHSSHTSISTVQFSVRPPSTIASVSPEFLPQRKQRQGWTNIPPVVDPSMSASSSMSSIAPLTDNRTSALLLEENLDNLERALAELSPRAGVRPRAHMSPATIMEEAAPVPEQPNPVEPAQVAPPPRTSSASPSSALPSLKGRAPFRYGMLSPPPDITPPADEQKPPFELQQRTEDDYGEPEPAAGLTSQMPGYEHDSPREIAATASAAASPIPAAVPFPHAPFPEQPAVARTPSDPVRIPRTSSLKKDEHRQQQPRQLSPQPQLVALPPSPLPNSPMPETVVEENESIPVLPSASPSWPAEPPLPPVPSASEVAHSPLPPRKGDDEENPLDIPPPPPRSPGPLKGFRAGKWGGKGKGVDVTKATSPDLGEENGAKSPLGSFFGKSTFGKAKGFFRRGDSSSPDAPPVPLPSESAFSPPLPTEPAFPPRKQSLDLTVPEAPMGRSRGPSVFDGSQPPTSSPFPPFPPSLAANTTSSESSFTPRPPFLADSQPVESFQTAQTTLYSPPTVSPSPALTPPEGAEIFAAPLNDSRPSAPPMSAAAPSNSDFLLASPSSDYTPQTPRGGASGVPFAPFAQPQQYPASAPVTPADWRTPGGTPKRPRGARQHRFSADIDQLLSQMNEIIDDGEKQVVLEAGAAAPKPAKEVEPAPVTPTLPPSPHIVEPEPDVELAYGGSTVAPFSPEKGDDKPLFDESDARGEARTEGMLHAPAHHRGQDEQGRSFPLSADLTALGSMMTGLVASPPMSPDSSYGDYSHAPSSSSAIAPV
ncbi:hypothetical protein JCM10213v2_003144 [Rhodosporidiobolus nylandii]